LRSRTLLPYRASYIRISRLNGLGNILELIQQEENISYSKISQILEIPEAEVEKRTGLFSDVRKKILIVDDEMATLMPLKRSLESEDYAVIEAYDGLEAIKKAKEEIPDLIILDLMLPGLNGHEVCQHQATSVHFIFRAIWPSFALPLPD